MTRSPSQLVTSNKDEIAKIIIGPQATAKDLGSVRNILRALKKYSPEKYDIVMSDEKLRTKLANDILAWKPKINLIDYINEILYTISR